MLEAQEASRGEGQHICACAVGSCAFDAFLLPVSGSIILEHARGRVVGYERSLRQNRNRNKFLPSCKQFALGRTFQTTFFHRAFLRKNGWPVSYKLVDSTQKRNNNNIKNTRGKKRGHNRLGLLVAKMSAVTSSKYDVTIAHWWLVQCSPTIGSFRRWLLLLLCGLVPLRCARPFFSNSPLPSSPLSSLVPLSSPSLLPTYSQHVLYTTLMR